jgi:hypothetical protein
MCGWSDQSRGDLERHASWLRENGAVAWFRDLGSINYFGNEERVPLRPVGWLSGVHEFTTGEVETSYIARLRELLVYPWVPLYFMGFHGCELCLGDGVPFEQVSFGISNLFVPSGSVLYVAPEMIVHYIESHRYAPPDEFLNAVRECPPMGSDRYLRALIAAGAAGPDPTGVHHFEERFHTFQARRNSSIQQSNDS